MKESDMEWDLSPMVKGASASEVESLLKQVVKDTEKVVEVLRNAVASASPAKIADAFRESEKAFVKVEDVVGYCGLRYYADSTDKEATQLFEWSRSARSEIMQLRKPIELRLGKLVLESPELISKPELSDYVHFLERLQASAPYYLSEAEETMIIAKDVYGIDIMAQLQESWVSEKVFEIEVGGEKKTVPVSVLSSMRMDPDRSVREYASKTLYKSFADDKLLHGTALRSICADHVTMAKRRNMPTTMMQALLDNDVDERTAESLLSAIENTSDKFQKFLKLKAKIMGLDKLAGYDVIAPIAEKPAWKFNWSEARNVVIDSFSAFDDDIGKVVKDLFTSRLIDAANRVGKIDGAFCDWWLGAKKSYVFLSFNETMNDVFTLGHECGHAAQGHMTYHTQVPSNYDSTACMAETGSIFGELLLTERLLNMSDSDEKRLEILAHVLGDFFYTVYYVGTRALFEKSVYSAIQDGTLIDADKACELWVAAKSRVFGNSVDWSMAPNMEYEWARIPHHFIPNYRFYNWPYSFAQMLVYALYERYTEGNPEFMGQFKKLLSSGGSMSPKDQISLIGHDITDPKFWELGAKQADRFLDELKKLV